MTSTTTAPAPPHLVSLTGLAVTGIAAIAAWKLGPDTPAHRHAVAFAAAVCLGGSLLAWLAGWLRGPSASGRATASLAALGLRLFPAVAALGWLQSSGTELRAAGADRMLVFFYLSALAADLVRIIMGALGSPRRGGTERVI